MMIILCIIHISHGYKSATPDAFKVSGIPGFFGVSVYSFMCHHSLPSLVTPISRKRHIFSLFATDYVLILVFYLLLSLVGVFTFPDLQDIFTLNFLCDSSSHPITHFKGIEYFLALFPVFTLSSNFPIIAISLRNNIATLFKVHSERAWFMERIVFPVLAIGPPILVALIVDNVELLVSITGSYAGASIQYFIPASLLFFARRNQRGNPRLAQLVNPYTSPLRRSVWVIIVFIWAITAVILVTIYRFASLFK